MRRGKPQQQIYRPGSGPLRKSNLPEEQEPEPTSKTRSWASYDDPNYDEAPQRKPRKPEKQLYIPKPVANLRDNPHDNDYYNSNGNNEDLFNRSKRYSNRRRGNESNTEWRDRQLRQGSEPRAMPPPQRPRDTRSVEPTGPPPGRTYEKVHPKPPSGRRHSTIGLEHDRRPPHKPSNLDKLPPRLRKKILEENKLNHADDDWNGASLTFQGSYNPPGNYNPNHNQYHNQNSFRPAGYSTLPRGRGRARLSYDTPHRSRTPDLGIQSPCNSRPPTPTHCRTKSNDNLARQDSRPQSPGFYGRDYRREGRDKNNRRYWEDRRNHNEVQEENWATQLDKAAEVSDRGVAEDEERKDSRPETPEVIIPLSVSVGDSNAIFDWSEEVEQQNRLDAEALSDAPTRSSSVTSLVDIAKTSPPSSTRHPKRRSSRRNHRRSTSRDCSVDSQTGRRDGVFKIPQDPAPNRRNRRHSRDPSLDRPSRNPSREASFERERTRNRSTSINQETENWRDEIRSRKNSEREETHSRRNSDWDPQGDKLKVKQKSGVLVLPPRQPELGHVEHFQYPDVHKSCHQKSLFDHNNPGKPIIVKSPGSRVSVPGFSDNAEVAPPPLYTTDSYGNLRPAWYEEASDGFKSCHFPNVIHFIKRADNDLQYIMNSGHLLISWGTVETLRKGLKEALQHLLCKDLKFCQSENVEQHLWKILYHNIIEVTRKAITSDPANKEQYKGFLLYLLDEGTTYFEGLLEILEETYKFKLNQYLDNSVASQNKGLGYVGLALISAQKLFLFLGDLGRYREQVNETSNYGKCRQWYIKAHEINPKNGKPYNQLAVLAVYARRKLDAVYYYMRSLMSSNPVPSAKEYLTSLFDENRKKYEQGERKRREERLERAKQHMKQKESEDPDQAPGALRKEIWIRPDGGRRVHWTAQTVQEQKDSEEEDLAALSSVDVNKRFVISYLHVHGKLITRIGMESFQEAALQMLKEFRALLVHSPVPLPCNRFLQLLALNMFAIESTQLKDPQQLQAGYRSELQERALVVSLQMFNLILERCVALLKDHEATPVAALPFDVHVLLPAVKIWCDWMLCHPSVWNPPPSTQDFKVGNSGDVWSKLAALMNLLEKLDQSAASSLVSDCTEGFEQVKLPEDSVLSGFMPLMVSDPDISFAPKELDMEVAQFSLRMNKLLFFGTVFLCGLEPQVLKLEIENGFREYVSVVSTSNSRDSPVAAQELGRVSDVLLEGFSDEEEDPVSAPCEGTTKEVRDLLCRKVELERAQRRQELHKQRVKKILSQAVVSVHIEVRPKYLVPDTNCFIDHLDRITAITATHVYTLMVPIVVLSELEGLSRGGQCPAPSTRSSLKPAHVQRVALAAKHALLFLKSRPQAVKCVTTKGAVLSSTTFTTEDDSNMDASFKNDDKILATCLVLSKGHKEQEAVESEPKKLVSEVVLLTDDRNLRVKALARDVPVRELMDFMQWAGLG